MSLCPPCSAASNRWLYARMPTGPVSIAFGSGAAYDATPRGVEERRQARGRAWWALVREQRAGIARDCAAGFHVEDVTSNA